MAVKILAAPDMIGHLNDVLDNKVQPYCGWGFCLNFAIELAELEPDSREELAGLIWQVVWYEILPRWQDQEIDLQQTIVSLELITKHPDCFAPRIVNTSQTLLGQMLAELLAEQPFPYASRISKAVDSEAVDSEATDTDKVWRELFRATEELQESDELFIGQHKAWSVYLSPQDKAHSDLPTAFKIKIFDDRRHYAVLIWSTGKQRPLIISDNKLLDNLVDLCGLAVEVANNYLLKG